MSEMYRQVNFSDGKAPGAMRTIGEVCEALGLKPHVLRYWEQQFPMLSPLKRSGGRRLYRAEDVALVARIDRLVNHEGYTIKGARSVLEGKAGEAERQMTASQAGHAEAADRAPVDKNLVDDLRAVRNRLARELDI